MDERPATPNLPAYLLDPLDRQPADRLDAVAEYAASLAEWKRQRRTDEAAERRREEAISRAELDELSNRGPSTDPDDYEDVPASGAYITVKTTKRTDETQYRYYYWQWRDGNSWENEYIGPVDSS